MRVFVKDLPNAPHASAGQVLDLPVVEAQAMIARGAAVSAPDEPAVVPPAVPASGQPGKARVSPLA